MIARDAIGKKNTTNKYLTASAVQRRQELWRYCFENDERGNDYNRIDLKDLAFK